MEEELAGAISAAITQQSATLQAQGRLLDAIVIALHQSLPPLVPVIRDHFAALSDHALADVHADDLASIQDATDAWLHKLDTLLK